MDMEMDLNRTYDKPKPSGDVGRYSDSIHYGTGAHT